MLEDYAEQQGFANYVHFTDDGISGTRFDRPGFQKMIDEVKADRISVVIVKDMSRFGRDYLQVGTYMEVLRKHDTRLIALNDSVDTLKGDDEFTPFRNIMNEWYARDTSKKIRSAFQAKNLAGKHTSSSVPYGYLKSEQDKNQWVVDPVAAPIVQRIYRMAMEGKGPYQIANILSNEHIEIPAYYHQKLGIGLWKTREIKSPYRWGSSTIVHILTNPSYLGHTCNFKTRKHFKDKKSHYVDQDQWTIIKDTHEPIIDQETYDTVQRMRASIRRYPDGWGEVHPLAGLLYCADCGSPMYIHRTGNGNRTANFSCSGYGKVPVGSKCASGHWVNADSVMRLIQETLREIVRFSKEDEEEFTCIVRSEIENRQSSEMKGQKTRLTACQKRLDELETLLCKIYEDNTLGKLPDRRYQILEAQYTKEQEQKSADKFIALVKKYQNFEELDAVMLNQFIYKIFVHERDYKGMANSPQTIEIYFNFVGKFGMQEINSPSEEERAALKEKERLRQKRHEAYLRRKASGWQDAYYQKTKAAKKAGIDAKKEAIRAEDRAKGVYYLPNQKCLETEPKGESA
nr:recombinase family protein [Faecalibacterium gallinarum]